MYGEGAVIDRACQKWFAKFRAVSCLEMLHGWVDQLKLIAIKLANILKMSKSIKLLVRVKNVSFLLWKKTHMDFLGNTIQTFFRGSQHPGKIQQN